MGIEVLNSIKIDLEINKRDENSIKKLIDFNNNILPKLNYDNCTEYTKIRLLNLECKVLIYPKVNLFAEPDMGLQHLSKIYYPSLVDDFKIFNKLDDAGKAEIMSLNHDIAKDSGDYAYEIWLNFLNKLVELEELYYGY